MFTPEVVARRVLAKSLAESGLPGYTFDVWYGLLFPARTPAALVAKVNAEVNRALAVAQAGLGHRPFGAAAGEVGARLVLDVVDHLRLDQHVAAFEHVRNDLLLDWERLRNAARA